MNILVTGAQGFVGKNLCATLRNIAEGKDKSFGLDPDLTIFEYDVDTPPSLLHDWCAQCDFVFHLAGVNRPKDEREFAQGNRDFTQMLLDTLAKAGNACPVMLSSSIQAQMDNPYGQSKREAEQALLAHEKRCGAKALIYRFPNVFGKWCRPNYNSVVATFCHNIANNLPITVNDPEIRLTLVYIDDVVSALIAALRGEECREDGFCVVPITHSVSLGALAEYLRAFRDSRQTLAAPKVGDDFERKLYATYLSYLPAAEFSYPLRTHSDARGSFTEILRTAERGQFSVNISKPGITKGQHWHNTKNEKFVVVSGQGVIRFRRIDSEEILEYVVSGEKIEVVDIPTGYTHSIVNTGQSDMVTFMWASECFNEQKPDTFYLEV
ncbi:MAG: capsular polysaccharide biosynthesis protein CapF [Oscillospiraceae bacterium]|jgi:UDP-2-acetamido-2,6-beta-L-arabino-hexul-4-ose reductase|nr:capsular polysaccharide biosynthesis protein CapF [Oscillospiraceae bacterium]